MRSLGSSPLNEYAPAVGLARALRRISALEGQGEAQAGEITALDGRLDTLETHTYLHANRTATGTTANNTWTLLSAGWTTTHSSGLTMSSGLVTIPADGLYLYTAHTGYAGNSAGRRGLEPWINGAENETWLRTMISADGTSGTVSMHISGPILLEEGDTVGMGAIQTSGGSLALTESSFFLLRLF